MGFSNQISNMNTTFGSEKTERKKLYKILVEILKKKGKIIPKWLNYIFFPHNAKSFSTK